MRAARVSPTLTALAIALTAACGGEGQSTDTATTGETTTGTSTTIELLTSVMPTTEATTLASDTEVSPEVSCDCALPNNPELYAYDVKSCGWGPCGTIDASQNWGANTVLDVEALDCALDLLSSGTPGVVHFDYTLNGGFGHYAGIVRLGADRRGLSRTYYEEDLGCGVGALEMIELKPADYFVDCQAMPDPWDRFACLWDWKQDSLGEECAEGYDCI
jgi:hypothetical protein